MQMSMYSIDHRSYNVTFKHLNTHISDKRRVQHKLSESMCNAVSVSVSVPLLKDAYSQGFIINCLHFVAMLCTACVCSSSVSAFSHAPKEDI